MSRSENTVRSRAQIPGPSSQADHDHHHHEEENDDDPDDHGRNDQDRNPDDDDDEEDAPIASSLPSFLAIFGGEVNPRLFSISGP